LDDLDGVASPGHKLGQTVGLTLQKTLKDPLGSVAKRKGFYCDSQGPRPGLRDGKKVTWLDSHGIKHDLDYVFEQNASPTRRGDPVAFIEVAWRRYTKHSRAKSGEIGGALLPLLEKYPSVRFLGAIIAGAYTEQGLEQLRRSGIEVLPISFDTIRNAFAAEGIKIDYPENATTEMKRELNNALESLTESRLAKITARLWNAIKAQYQEFETRLLAELERVPKRIRIIPLFGCARSFTTVSEAIKGLNAETPPDQKSLNPEGYEILVEFDTGSEVNARFKTKEELLRFLNLIG
jgi:hypothetical protein